MALVGDPPDNVKYTVFGFMSNTKRIETLVWSVGSGYVYPESPTKMYISSTASEDVGDGDGARLIAVTGLDAGYVERTEFVMTRGQLQNSTSTQFWRLFRLEVHSAGTEGKNIGQIYAGTSGATVGVPNSNLFARVECGDNQSFMTLFTIPASYTGELESFWAGTATEDPGVELSIFTRSNSGAPFRLRDRREVSIGGAIDHIYKSQVNIPSRTDIEIQVRALDDPPGGSGGVDTMMGTYAGFTIRTLYRGL